MILSLFLTYVIFSCCYWLSCILRGQDLGEALYHMIGLLTAITLYMVVPLALIYGAVRVIF